MRNLRVELASKSVGIPTATESLDHAHASKATDANIEGKKITSLVSKHNQELLDMRKRYEAKVKFWYILNVILISNTVGVH